MSWVDKRDQLSELGDNTALSPLVRISALTELFFHLGNFDAHEKAKTVRRIQDIAYAHGIK
jgi:hypothetical protein